MAEGSKIQWLSSDGATPGNTWSPWRGCAKVGPGCKLCYAEAWSKRNPKTMGVWGPDGHRARNADWRKPLKWDREAAAAGVRTRVFPSLCDWLEDREDLARLRADFLDLVAATPHLDWLLLTKRPQNWSPMVDRIAGTGRPGGDLATRWLDGSPPPNVWFGVSVEDQAHADRRLPVAGMVPAVVRWASYEPALGPVDFRRIRVPFTVHGEDGAWDSLTHTRHGLGGLDWIVVGGESGQGGQQARPFDVEWARDAIRQGAEAGVPVFVKQLGSRPVDAAGGPVRVRDHHGGEPVEWPVDLRVHQQPAARRDEIPASRRSRSQGGSPSVTRA